MTHDDGGPPGFLVTGTDTGVGKTVVTAALARALSNRCRVGVCKIAVTGAADQDGRPTWDDVEQLASATNHRWPEHLVAPYRWRSPLAPPIAHAVDGGRAAFPLGGDTEPDATDLAHLPTVADYAAALDRWRGQCDFLLVEGVGGLLCPLTDRGTVADVAAAWRRPLIVVARLGLGTLNHTLMTVAVARHRGLEVAGVVLNETVASGGAVAERTNPAALAARLDVPVWGPLPWMSPPDPERLRADPAIATMLANLMPFPREQPAGGPVSSGEPRGELT